jgi:16S rRNA (cytosine967-C5)-methyltransferase
VLRHRRLLDQWISMLRDGKLDPETRDILRVGLCQLLILGLPDHAAVHETVEVGKSAVRGLINAVLRRATTCKQRLLDDAAGFPPSIRLSHPDLFNRWKSSFGKESAIALMEWNNQPAATFFRTNPLHRGAELPSACEPLADAPGFYQLDGPLPHDLLAQGAVYIQDPATRHAVDLLAPRPGERILDACAAPGGKAFLIAAALGGATGLVCTDSNEKRLPRLQDNLTRLHCGDATVEVHDWTVPAPESWHAGFDAILLDVPCSNTGVMRRRVDVRWRLQPRDITQLIEIQRRIVENALPCLRPGGRLVYSTCSLEAEENDSQIARILEAHPELTLAETRAALPFRDHTDGAFAALLVR